MFWLYTNDVYSKKKIGTTIIARVTDMQKRIVALKILCMGEVAMALRIFLLTVPLMLKKSPLPMIVGDSFEGKFLSLFNFLGLFYFMAGFAALIGHRWWKFFHLLSTVIIAYMTWGMVRFMNNFYLAIEPAHFIPVGSSVGFLIIIFIFGRQLKTI